MSTGSEPFSLLICLDATKFVLLSVFTLIETICPRNCSKSRLRSAKSPLPVDVRRSTTSLLKLPAIMRSTNDLFSLLSIFSPAVLRDAISSRNIFAMVFSQEDHVTSISVY